MAWILRDQIATWDAGEWIVSVDLHTDPRLAIRRNGVDRFIASVNPQDGDEAPSETSLVLADSYVRQRDLVAAYPEQAPLRFGYQTYVSVVDTDQCASECVSEDTNEDTSVAGNSSLLAIECWLSVQTSTLEAYPQLILNLAAGDAKLAEQSAEGVYLSSDKKTAVIVHPLDASDARLDKNSRDVQTLVAFGRFMEKGVIRRLRARIILSDQPMEAEEWKACREIFANSPLPLTT